MWVEQFFELTDSVRSSIPLCMAVLLPLLIIFSPAEAAVEFPAYRLQQFDLQGVKYGREQYILKKKTNKLVTSHLLLRLKEL